MNSVEFLLSKRSDMEQVQKDSRIPLLWMLAQFTHESGSTASALAEQHNNWGGLKWAEWQRQYGCVPVAYGTWEEVEGNIQNQDDLFCSCGAGDAGWGRWLKVYVHLITNVYSEALPYADDPLLFGFSVWSGGYATDSKYIIGTARWMLEYHARLSNPVQAVEDWKQQAVSDLLKLRFPDGDTVLETNRPAEQLVQWWELAFLIKKIVGELGK